MHPLLPEEIELAKKLRVVERLTERLADSEEAMVDLRSEQESFEARYMMSVGRLYAEMDEIEAQIAEEEYKLVPDDFEIKKKAEDTQDFVIVRSDGTPVFHLSNVVDDIDMAITHVIRGDDHVENTFKHIELFKAIGAPVPQYAHLPMIVNNQGKPYSKRDGAAWLTAAAPTAT